MNSKFLSRWRMAGLSLGLLALAGVTGCAVDMSSHTETTGTFIGPETARQIVPGKTESFVEALVGEPTKKDKVSDNDEIWKYIYVEKHIANGNAMLITGTASNTENTRTTFVEFVDGKVIKCWQD